MTKKRKILAYIFLTVVSFLSIFPLYWMFSAATNKSIDVSRGRLLPGLELMNNFKNLTGQYNLGLAMANSIKYALVLTFISLFVCSLAGYGFEIYHDKAKDRLMNIGLLSMIVPFVAIIIPLYQMFSKLGILNSTLGFILPTISTPLLIMLFRQSARSFPKDIIEAARMDGLSEFQIFYRMFIPTMKSTYAAAMTITFMAAWNSDLWPKLIMTNKTSITMPMLVANLKEGYVTDYGILMLAVFLCTIPTAIVFFLLQRNFTEGITGAVK